jgi:hypothetical protein
MKKRLLILLVIGLPLVSAGIAGYVYLKESSKPVIRNEISERSKEFIATQAKKEDSSWQTVNLGKKRAGESDFDSQVITVKNCYSIVIPFQIIDDRQNDPCIYYAILESPRGNMTTSLREVGFKHAADAPDVSFRRSKKELYKESSIETEKGSFLVFTDNTTGTGTSAFGMVDGKLFTVTLNIGASDEIQIRQMKKIIESLEIE